MFTIPFPNACAFVIRDTSKPRAVYAHSNTVGEHSICSRNPRFGANKRLLLPSRIRVPRDVCEANSTCRRAAQLPSRRKARFVPTTRAVYAHPFSVILRRPTKVAVRISRNAISVSGGMYAPNLFKIIHIPRASYYAHAVITKATVINVICPLEHHAYGCFCLFWLTP